jgi:hypothetical protein
MNPLHPTPALGFSSTLRPLRFWARAAAVRRVCLPHSALFREFWRPSFGVQRKGDGMEYLANPEAFFLTRAGSDEMLRVEA